MKKIKVGILGAGLIAEEHAISLSAIGAVKEILVFDVDAARAEKMARKFSATVAASQDALIGECDLVWICTPPAFHLAAIEAAADAGKPIFCEKPLAHTAEEAKKIRTLVKRRKLVFHMGQSGRYSKSFAMMKQAVERGDVGDVRQVWSVRQGRLDVKSTPAWRMDDRASGGVAVELGVHEIDFINWIAGPPRAVTARGDGRLVGKKFTDTVSALGDLKGGATARLDLCWAHPRYLWQRGVDGSAGSLVFDDAQFNAFTLHIPGKKPKVIRTGETDWKNWDTGENLTFRAQDRAVVLAVRKGEKPAVTVDDGYDAVRVAAAINESVKAGKPVKVTR